VITNDQTCRINVKIEPDPAELSDENRKKFIKHIINSLTRVVDDYKEKL
jgi:hypothetical protein